MVDAHIRMMLMNKITTYEDLIKHDLGDDKELIWISKKGCRCASDYYMTLICDAFDVVGYGNKQVKRLAEVVDLEMHKKSNMYLYDIHVIDTTNGNQLSESIVRLLKKLRYAYGLKPTKHTGDEALVSKFIDGAFAVTRWYDDKKYGDITLAFKGERIDIMTRNKKRCVSRFVNDLDKFIKMCCEKEHASGNA